MNEESNAGQRSVKEETEDNSTASQASTLQSQA